MMKTIDFELQYYYRRWLALLPVLIVNLVLAALIGNYLDGALYYVVKVKVFLSENLDSRILNLYYIVNSLLIVWDL